MAVRRPRRLALAIPASLVLDVPHLREKTAKVGLVGRAAAIFRADEVRVYVDRVGEDVRRAARFVTLILRYMETPQYLRKRLFRLMPELRYAGVLPPLRTPHHPLRDKVSQLRVGEFREGVVVSASSRGSHVDIGVERPAIIRGRRLPLGARITVRVVDVDGVPVAEVVDRSAVREYWGYEVPEPSPSLKAVLKSDFDLVVATSRRGEPLASVVDQLVDAWKGSRRVLVAFGSPTEGLYEIAAREGVDLEEYAQFVVNTIPRQGVETVRTEEAVYATLAVLNFLLGE